MASLSLSCDWTALIRTSYMDPWFAWFPFDSDMASATVCCWLMPMVFWIWLITPFGILLYQMASFWSCWGTSTKACWNEKMSLKVQRLGKDDLKWFWVCEFWFRALENSDKTGTIYLPTLDERCSGQWSIISSANHVFRRFQNQSPLK